MLPSTAITSQHNFPRAFYCRPKSQWDKSSSFSGFFLPHQRHEPSYDIMCAEMTSDMKLFHKIRRHSGVNTGLQLWRGDIFICKYTSSARKNVAML